LTRIFPQILSLTPTPSHAFFLPGTAWNPSILDIQ
jgi:hypothetical protein